MSDNPYIIQLEGIRKTFGTVVANDNINIQIRKGDIHAIAGENGAGKSTLMSTIYGLHSPDSGIMKIRGKETSLTGPKDAILQGIGMVHQHFMLIPKLTVTQNIILGMEPGNTFRIDYDRAKREVQELSEMYGLGIDPDEIVGNISVPMQQRVEILKVLYRKAEILIFDEPTAVLTPQQIDEFCQIMERLRSRGKTIIFISHKLAEVMRTADYITVIRLGRVVGTVSKAETSEKELTTMMVGREVTLGGGDRTHELSQASRAVLTLHDVGYSCDHVQKLHNINLEVNRGEILGVAGIDGNGQDELVGIISGKLKCSEGKYLFLQQETDTLQVKQMKKLGLGVIYEDRHKDGLVLDYSVAENLILGYQDEPKFVKGKHFLNKKAIADNASRLVEEYDIRCGSINHPARSLSGGNQQKIILAREMDANPECVMAVQPTRGLDLGAIEFVHKKLMEARNNDKAVLLLSLELDEILQLSDRIAVIFKGEIVAVLDNKNLTKEQLGGYMLGATQPEVEYD